MTFNVFDIYPYYDDRMLYLDLDVDLRVSLLQVERTNVECLMDVFMDQIDNMMSKKKPRCTKRPI
jgi:hypothetical protein